MIKKNLTCLYHQRLQYQNLCFENIFERSKLTVCLYKLSAIDYIKIKAYKIQVGLRNNFRLAGWDLGSPCVQTYHVILLNSRTLHPEFESELRKSACLSSLSKRWEGFVICLSCQLNYLQEIK